MILGLEHATVCLTQDKTTNYAQNRASFLITACSQVDVQFSGGYPRANRSQKHKPELHPALGIVGH